MALPQNYRQIIPSPGPSAQRLRAAGGSGSSSSKDSPNQNPFIINPHGNPAFHPQKLSKNAQNDARGPKPPKPPEKPLMPYMRYSRKMWDQVKTENPDKKIWEIGRIIGQMWRELPEEIRTEYCDEYEAEKLEYEKKMKIYENSPAYLAYLASKSKGKIKESADERDGHERSSSSSKSAADRRIDIQPAEDEEDMDDGLSAKRIAFNRYKQNHLLISEIFSDSVVPDVRSVVTTTRMQVLKRQVQSLTKHQEKLESELQMIEDKFEIKKKKFIESSEAFNADLKKHCEKVIDEEMFERMVQQQLEILRKERTREGNPAVAPPAPAQSPISSVPEEKPAPMPTPPPPLQSAPTPLPTPAPSPSLSQPTIQSNVTSAMEVETLQTHTEELPQVASSTPAVVTSEPKESKPEVKAMLSEPVSSTENTLPPPAPVKIEPPPVTSTTANVAPPTNQSYPPQLPQQPFHPQSSSPGPGPMPPQSAGHPYPPAGHATAPYSGHPHVPIHSPIPSMPPVPPSMHPVPGQQPSQPIHPSPIHPHPPMVGPPPPPQGQNAYPPYQYPGASQPLPPRPPHPYNYPQSPYPQYPPHGPHSYYQNPYPPYNAGGHIQPARPHAHYPPHMSPSGMEHTPPVQAMSADENFTQPPNPSVVSHPSVVERRSPSNAPTPMDVTPDNSNPPPPEAVADSAPSSNSNGEAPSEKSEGNTE